jgi:hypothetical protein
MAHRTCSTRTPATLAVSVYHDGRVALKTFMSSYAFLVVPLFLVPQNTYFLISRFKPSLIVQRMVPTTLNPFMYLSLMRFMRIVVVFD